MKIVFSPKHKNALASPGVFTDVLINCGPECHNDQDPGFVLGQLVFPAHSGLPQPGLVVHDEVEFSRWSSGAWVWKWDHKTPSGLSDSGVPLCKDIARPNHAPWLPELPTPAPEAGFPPCQ